MNVETTRDKRRGNGRHPREPGTENQTFNEFTPAKELQSLEFHDQPSTVYKNSRAPSPAFLLILDYLFH